VQLDIQIKNHHNTALYNRNHEANEVWRVTQPEIDSSIAEVHRIFNNTRVSDADIEGIEDWERVYDITPSHESTPEERRNAVLERIRTQPLYTETWMLGNHFANTDPEKIQGVIAERFPDGEVTVELQGLRINIFIDLSRVIMNEWGFTRRDIRELLPWFRTWMPTNILTMVSMFSENPEIACEMYVAGFGHRLSSRKILRKSIDIDFGKAPRASEGVHFANVGGMWQEIVSGFCGMANALSSTTLSFRPCLPEQIKKVDFQIIWQGQKVEVKVSGDLVTVNNLSDKELTFKVYEKLTTVDANGEVQVSY
jgi:hypothetical protein